MWRRGLNKIFALPPVQRLASSTQGTMIVNNRFRASHSVYNSWPHRGWDNGRARFTTADAKSNRRPYICTYFVFETRISSQRDGWGRLERGDRISVANFLTVFRSNCGSILFSFRDMTTEWTIDNGRRTDDDDDNIAHLALAGQL